jgi:hypothetical protein
MHDAEPYPAEQRGPNSTNGRLPQSPYRETRQAITDALILMAVAIVVTRTVALANRAGRLLKIRSTGALANV